MLFCNSPAAVVGEEVTGAAFCSPSRLLTMCGETVASKLTLTGSRLATKLSTFSGCFSEICKG